MSHCWSDPGEQSGCFEELVVADEIRKLYGIKGFDNSLSFDENGNTSTCIVLYAKKDKDIIALAGASYVNSELREVGIDVKKEFRGKKTGFATGT